MPPAGRVLFPVIEAARIGQQNSLVIVAGHVWKHNASPGLEPVLTLKLCGLRLAMLGELADDLHRRSTRTKQDFVFGWLACFVVQRIPIGAYLDRQWVVMNCAFCIS